MNTRNFIDGLNKLNFVKYENKTFYTAEGFEVSYELSLMDGYIRTNYPIQFTFYVRKEGLYVMRWGCESNECNAIAGTWVESTKWGIKDRAYKLEDEAKDKALAEFNKLTQLS
jgi:hypothetical protein